MMQSLWNLSNLEADTKNMPNAILSEQAKIFEKATKNTLYCNISNVSVKDSFTGASKLATKFSIVAPNLDKYTYVVCTIFSTPESDYPVIIKENDGVKNIFEEGIECNSYEDLIKTLEGILSSERVTNVIKNLYSKSNII